MRDLFKKAVAGSMIAGAALLVSACGGGENAEANNTAMTEMGTDPMMDGTTNDVTAIDAGTGADANMAMDANMTMDANTTTNTTTTDANMTNGM
ncbi:MAG TPA: hypothetical protein VGD10_12770 [Allosphingosinicella sp.]|uniref:hypothetical protein n=1 Tax=Allosphingosinicella sp. TaxID=2823234 RepID=UPI002ED9A4B1